MMSPTHFNILMVAPTSFFADYGGHIRILEEARGLQSLGHRVTIVTYYQGKDVPGLTIHRTRALPWRASYEVGSSRHKLAFDVYLAAKALRVMGQVKPDIVHGHMHEGALIGWLLAKLWRKPLVFDFQGSLTGEMVDHHFLNPQGALYPWMFRLEQAIASRLPDAVLTSSLRAQDLLVDQFHVPASRIHPLPDCANLEQFDPARFTTAQKQQQRQQLGIPPERLVVAYLGLLADYQGTDHLLQAAAQLKKSGHDIHFLIMGFPHVDHYQAMAHDLDVASHVTFTGRVDYYRDAPGFLAVGDVAISPKMSLTEGSGKVLNYMALGQPVVAYDTPVHREYLGEWGVYVPVGDVDGLAQAIAAFGADPARRQRVGQALRQRASEKFSWRAASQTILRVYQGLTNASPML